jgi:hypothetical protein
MKEGFQRRAIGAETWIVANLYLVADFHESCTIRVTIKRYCTIIEAKNNRLYREKLIGK